MGPTPYTASSLRERFIPLAEESGLISEIGDWVLEESVSQFAAWCRQSPEMRDLYVSVNLSGAQLHDNGIVDRVADVLAVNGLAGSSLCLELTESVVMDDPAAAAAVLRDPPAWRAGRHRRLRLGVLLARVSEALPGNYPEDR